MAFGVSDEALLDFASRLRFGRVAIMQITDSEKASVAEVAFGWLTSQKRRYLRM